MALLPFYALLLGIRAGLRLQPSSGWPTLTRRHALWLPTAAFISATGDNLAGVMPAAAIEEPSSAIQPPLPLFTETFGDNALGLVLVAAPDGRIQVSRVLKDSAAWRRGVPPLVFLDSINNVTVAGLPVADVQEQIKRTARPITISFDPSAYAGLQPDEVVEKASSASGFETSRVTIEKGSGMGYGDTCSFRTREADVIEFDYTGRLAQTGAVFDSTELGWRGRPFGALLGNGDMVRGLELGLLEMCIGEERTLRVPASLGFGARGSRTYGVPPASALVYQVKLLSINGVVDPLVRREDVPDEQRFY